MNLIDRFCHWWNARTIERLARHEDDPWSDALAWMNSAMYPAADRDTFDHDALMGALAEDCDWRGSRFRVIGVPPTRMSAKAITWRTFARTIIRHIDMGELDGDAPILPSFYDEEENVAVIIQPPFKVIVDSDDGVRIVED